jgi:hypothetical protein
MDILEFEKQWPHNSGNKNSAIRDVFDIPPVRYYQRLNRLMDTQEALVAEPVLVRRLQRLRDQRKAARAGHKMGTLGHRQRDLDVLI